MTNIRRIEKPIEFDAMVEEQRGHLLIEGDSGGDVYVVAPVTSLKLGCKELFLLMHDLESLDQVSSLSKHDIENVPCSPGYDAWMYNVEFEGERGYQKAVIGNDIWVSPFIVPQIENIRSQVLAVLGGVKERISLDVVV